MPRKTKELDTTKNTDKTEPKVNKKAVEKKPKQTKQKTDKKTNVTTKEDSKKSSKTTVKKANDKKTKSNNSVKKESTKKEQSTKKITTSTKKATSTKKTTRKALPEKNSTTRRTRKSKPEIVEYYDLPLSYNQTVVKILYQTPTTLFVYWEISNDDAEKYKSIYGDNFFETTKPVLIVHNDTLNYSFEIDINDFANSWYFNVNDSKSVYRVELGRRPVPYHSEIKEQYIYISSSNIIESPNDKILFEKYMPNTITFKNVKNNNKSFVSLKELFKNASFSKTISNLYKIKIEDLYKAIYQNDNTSDLYKLLNPSSNGSSF